MMLAIDSTTNSAIAKRIELISSIARLDAL